MTMPSKKALNNLWYSSIRPCNQSLTEELKFNRKINHICGPRAWIRVLYDDRLPQAVSGCCTRTADIVSSPQPPESLGDTSAQIWIFFIFDKTNGGAVVPWRRSSRRTTIPQDERNLQIVSSGWILKFIPQYFFLEHSYYIWRYRLSGQVYQNVFSMAEMRFLEAVASGANLLWALEIEYIAVWEENETSIQCCNLKPTYLVKISIFSSYLCFSHINRFLLQVHLMQ